MTTHSSIADLTLQLSRGGRRDSVHAHTWSEPRSIMFHRVAVLALAIALSGTAPNVAAARGGGGRGQGGGGGHMGGGIGSDFVAGSGGVFGGSHISGFGGGPIGGFGSSHVGGFGSSPVGGFEGSHFAGYGGNHVNGFGSFGANLGGLSAGKFRGALLAMAVGHFASPSALKGRHTPTTGRRVSMHYRGRHRMRYYAGDCFIGAQDPYYCQPYAYYPCSTLP